MTNNSEKSTPKLRQTLKEDFRKINNFPKDIHREYRNLNEFYINREQRRRLESLPLYKRWFFQGGWLLKSMFLNLTPIRRILVLAGAFFLFIQKILKFNSSGSALDDTLLGGLLILFVLFLELKDKLLAKNELEAGRKVQQALMPEQTPVFPGWQIWLYTRPANDVGGDLVDHIRLSDSKTGLAIADVAGKGLQAALLTSKLQSTIRALADDNLDLPEFGNRINKIFHRDSLPNLFASMIFVQINSKSNEVEFINAGHFPPLIVRGKEIKSMSKGNAALGILPETEFNLEKVWLDNDEIFIVYSDGVFEARNENGEFLGMERFYELIKYYSGSGPVEMGKSIISQVENFAGDSPVADDISLIIMKRTA